MLTRKHLKTSALLGFFLLVLSAAAPLRAGQPDAQALQGAWAGSNGSDTMLLMFMGNVCGMALNGQQMYGMWSLAGDRLNIRFQNGKTLSYSIAIQGDSLILDGSVRLTRQAMPNQPGGGVPGGQPVQPQQPQPGGWGQPQPGPQPQGSGWGQPQQPQPGGWGQPQPGPQPQGSGWGQPQQPQPGGWGQPQPGPQPQGGGWGQPQQQPQPGGWGQPQPGPQPQGGGWGAPQPQAGPTPLEGSWFLQTPQGRLTFRFMGNRYAQLFNGQLAEEGTFNYLPDGRLQYRITGGQNAGQSGENRVMVNGNTLTFIWANGMSAVFMRDSQ